MSGRRSQDSIDQREQLSEIYAPISADLVRMESALAAELTSCSAAVQQLLQHVSRYRGKRLRPALVLLSGKAAGGLTEEHVPLAVIIEMIHTATLVHDDVLDDASTRRGVPSVNALYSNDIPVLLGDYIYARAFALATSLQDQTASRSLSKVTEVICQGEIDQIFSRQRFDLEKDAYFRIIEAKTAVLYAAAARLGTYYAGGRRESTEAMWHYGLNLGIAFQIIDDCLDLTGHEGVVGKSLGTDLEKGKMTLPLMHLVAGLSEAERQRFESLFVDGEIANKRRALREMFDLSASLRYAQEEADGYVRKALAALPPLDPGPSRESLELIGRYVLERDR